MDPRINEAIEKHEDFQRLERKFSLDFVVSCMLDSRKADTGTAKIVGRLLKEHGRDPSLFVNEVLYHERAELADFRNLGYSDSRLGDTRIGDQNYDVVHGAAKRREMKFIQHVGDKVLGEQLPFLAIVFGTMGPGPDYDLPIPPYQALFRSIQQRMGWADSEYKNPFTMENVEGAISLFKLGGDKCTGEKTALSYAKDYLSGRKSDVTSPPPWAF
jgi:hypothetical protein